MSESVTEYTEDGATHRLGDVVMIAPGASAYQDDPERVGRILAITVDDDEATYWVRWAGATRTDPQGPMDFRTAVSTHL